MAWPAALRIRFNNAGLPGWEDRFIRYGWPFARRYVKHVLDIRPGIEAEDEAAVFGELDYVAELLRDVVRTCAASASARALARGVV